MYKSVQAGGRQKVTESLTLYTPKKPQKATDRGRGKVYKSSHPIWAGGTPAGRFASQYAHARARGQAGRLSRKVHSMKKYDNKRKKYIDKRR